jgi:vitamin B12 transporter
LLIKFNVTIIQQVLTKGYYVVKICLLLASALLAFENCFAQIDSTITIKTVHVISTRNKEFAVGSKTVLLDSNKIYTYNNNNLSNLLNDQSGIFIKSYGLGGLATTSMRGGSAYHTAVIWNGFNIANSLNGNVDLSLMKNFLIDEIAIQYGGSSALWGSGAIGGAVLLNSKKEFDKGLSVSVGGSVGSFRNFQQNISLDYSSKKFNSSLKLINENAKNDFEYIIPQSNIGEENKKIKQVNNQLSQTGLLSENHFQLNAKNKINFIGFFQNSQRQIAPTIYQNNNHAKQDDKIIRLTSEWQFSVNKFIFQARAAYFDEKLFYSDDFLLGEGTDKSRSVITESEVNYHLNNYHLFNFGINNTNISAFSENYKNKINQNQLAAFAAYRFQSINEKLEASISARKGIQNKFIIPFTCTAGLNVTLLQGVVGRGQFSKVYRIPTINDLYWNPGGNPDLLSEYGFTEEIGVNINANQLFSNKATSVLNTIEKFKLTIDVTYFNKNINEWIIWLPRGSIWSPKNIFEVWSRGVETSIDFTIQKSSFQFGVNTKISYIVSTNQKSTNEQDLSIGRQLIYVPLYATVSNVFIGYRNFYFNYNHQYNGYRYTSSDNYQYLFPYHLNNFQISKSIFKKNKILKSFICINNVFNKNYQVLAGRSMPLRNYQIGINLTINKAKQK